MPNCIPFTSRQLQRRPANCRATPSVIDQTSLLVRSSWSVLQGDLESESANPKLHGSSQLLDMAGRDISRKLLFLLLILLPSLAAQGAKHGPRYVQLFAHESRVPPTNTLIASVAPSGSNTGADEFGLIRTVSNVLREGRSNESTILGSQVGTIVVGKDGANVYISFTYFLNVNATHQGTIAVHGHIDGTSTVDRVFAVVGGTDDFLSATGEDRSTFDSANPPDPANVVNVHNLTLHYPHW